MMEVALLGPKGTYTHQAAEKYFENLETVFKNSITDVFYSNEDYKLLPVENSLQGDVTETIDLLKTGNNYVVGEEIIEISHCLITNEKSLEDVKKVYSHPQALSQCKKFIENNNLDTEKTKSTAKAAENLDEGEAAIASKIAGKIYDLNVLRENIQDKKNNFTRFLVLSEKQSQTDETDKTSIIIEPEEDKPGLLASILSCFSGHGVNLSHIQSRPTREELGKYFFYIEAETPQNDKEMRKAIKCSNTYAKTTPIGSYKSDNKR